MRVIGLGIDWGEVWGERTMSNLAFGCCESSLFKTLSWSPSSILTPKDSSGNIYEFKRRDGVGDIDDDEEAEEEKEKEDGRRGVSCGVGTPKHKIDVMSCDRQGGRSCVPRGGMQRS